MAERSVLDWLVGVATVLRLGPDGNVADSRVVVSGVAGAPVRAAGAEGVLAGQAPSAALWTAAAEHMTRIGRIYLTTPLYKAFVKTPEGLAYAEQVYAKARAGYHPLTQQVVENILAKAKTAK